MSDSDEYTDDEYTDEDISALEDNPAEDIIEDTDVVITSEGLDPIAPDTPVYRLRLSYSNEIFLAAYKGGDPSAIKTGSMVLIPTRYGRDLAQVIAPVHQGCPHAASGVTRIERPASRDDLERAAYNAEQEKDALKICREKIDDRRLEMKLVSAHYLLEEAKILFFFTAESRVDFRELVKDLVNIFKTRIELRQIGVRDESRVLGGLGVCGRAYCCHAVSDKLKPVSIKMAKDQNLSLNSMKISGSCGRLLCCLAYEHCVYSEQRKLMPPEGCRIVHDGAQWKVVELNVVKGKVKLSAEDGRQIQIPAAHFAKVDNRWRITETGEAGLQEAEK